MEVFRLRTKVLYMRLLHRAVYGFLLQFSTAAVHLALKNQRLSITDFIHPLIAPITQSQLKEKTHGVDHQSDSNDTEVSEEASCGLHSALAVFPCRLLCTSSFVPARPNQNLLRP